MSDVDLREAGRAFGQWLEATGMSASAFARQVPCSVNYPGMWSRGVARPSYRMARRIEELTYGLVPTTNWYPPLGLGINTPSELELSEYIGELNVTASC